MEIFTVHDVIQMLLTMSKTYLEFGGAIAVTLVHNAMLPLHQFDITTVLGSVGAITILWRKKSWILSGLSHIYHIDEILLNIIRIRRSD